MTMFARKWNPTLLGVIALLWAASAVAQIIIPEPPREMPPWPMPQVLEVASIRVKVEMNDAAATTELDQVFHNPCPGRLEGTKTPAVEGTRAV